MAPRRDRKGRDNVDASMRATSAAGDSQNAQAVANGQQENGGQAAAEPTATISGTNSAAGAAQPQPIAGAPHDKVAVLGHAVWLMSNSPLHKFFFLADLEWMLVPPVAQQQFRLWMDKGKPEGFATWALVNDEVEARLKAGMKRLAPQEWRCGEHLWLMDLVAPFGGADNALKDLKNVLQGKTIKTMRMNPQTQQMELVEL